MKTKVVFGAMIGAVGLSVFATPVASRYQAIAEKNVFHLSPEPPPKIDEKPLPPQPKVLLAGFSTIGGFKRAFLRVQYPAQPGQPAKEESLTLAEGQGEGGVEVVTINDAAKLVTVTYEGSPMTLTFDKDGVKTPSNASASVPPGAPGVVANQGPGAIPAAPATTNPATSPAAAAQIRAGILRRSLRLPNPSTQAPAPTTTVAPPPSSAALGVPGAKAEELTDKTATKLTPQEEEILRALENGQAPQ